MSQRFLKRFEEGCCRYSDQRLYLDTTSSLTQRWQISGSSPTRVFFRMFDGCRVPLAISCIQTPKLFSGMNLAMPWIQNRKWINVLSNPRLVVF